ncbi:PREDICTED: uncharacterized protein C1orf131 homolog [Gekko japonicus]|uniref:Uncharacterized protein C1orf131 homolog n=1 Tax=Gekko japonicus TaxID=146911 RepID=A0ABM1K997_GEKJA|nr:PREDICTED: uncharacterized protein C1orf131 homolog [Gekko japonicus]
MAKTESLAGEREAETAEEDAGIAVCLLDTVLDSLYDFGESLHHEGNKKKRSKKKKSQKLGTSANSAFTDDDSMKHEHSTVMTGKRQSASSFFENLKNELDCDSVNPKRPLQELGASDIVPHKLAPPEKAAEVEVVTFHGHKRKKKPKLEIADACGSKVK